MIAAGFALLAALSASEFTVVDADSALRWTVSPAFEVAQSAAVEQPVRFDASRFDSVTAVSLRAIIDSAVALKLPAGLLINRAYEGAARHKSGKMIVQVVRMNFSALVDAKVALGDSTTTDELEAGADAIRAGVDGKALVAIRSARPAGTATTALVVVTDLIQRGVPAQKAREAVTSLARLPNPDAALNGLQSMVAKNAARGGAGMAVEALERYVRGTVPGTASPAAPPSARPPTRSNPQ